MWDFVNWDIGNNFQWNSNQNKKTAIQINLYKHVAYKWRCFRLGPSYVEHPVPVKYVYIHSDCDEIEFVNRKLDDHMFTTAMFR